MCIAQWIAFDDWCSLDPTASVDQCRNVKAAFDAEMDKRGIVILAEKSVFVTDENNSAYGFVLGAGLMGTALACMVVRKCYNKGTRDFVRV